MFIATMDTENYSWMALGRTEDEAEEALRRKWNERQYTLVEHGIIDEEEMSKADSVDELSEWYGIYTEELEPGECIYH